MKKLYILMLAFALFGCQDYLDETAKGKLIPETVSDMYDIMNDVLGDYNAYGGGESNGICRGTSFSIYMTDDILTHPSQNNTFNVVGKKAYSFQGEIYGAGESDPQWNQLYHAIYLCNWVISNIDKAEMGDYIHITRENVKAIAKANRAFNYFMLVNDYAPFYNAATADKDLAIPMPTIPGVETNLPQSTVKDVYNLMIDDLTSSMDDLNTTEPKTFLPSQAGANALLAKIYMHMKDYDNMLIHAKDAIDSNIAMLDYNTIIPGMMSDFMIAGGYGTPLKTWTIPGKIWFREQGGGTVFYKLTPELINLFDTSKDLRYSIFITSNLPLGFTPTEHIRTTMTHDFSQSIRMAEVYLMAAEASVMATNGKSLENARDYLNAVRKHRMVAPEDIEETSEALLLQEILNERRRELRVTPMRWYDMKRFGLGATHEIDGETYTYDPSDEYHLPIPGDVIEANPYIQ